MGFPAYPQGVRSLSHEVPNMLHEVPNLSHEVLNLSHQVEKFNVELLCFMFHTLKILGLHLRQTLLSYPAS